jgi:hypothetical protein
LPVILVNKVVDPKRIIGKTWRAEEEVRHKGLLTKKKTLEGLAMVDVGTFYGHLFYLTYIWYLLCPFRYILWSFSVLVCCTKKNLATLVLM